jgi:DNA-directed RNA polymerase specialized sigma24 family protein
VYAAEADQLVAGTAGNIDVVEIDEALEKLAQKDERLAQCVELHYFGGLTYQETARALGTSEATVHRDLRMAKAWILQQIKVPRREGSSTSHTNSNPTSPPDSHD